MGITEDLFRRYDLVLIGDGSGTNKVGGWSVVLIFGHYPHQQGIFCGSVSNTTISIMELLGYVHVLSYVAKYTPIDENRKPNVLILSDSQYVVNCGNGDNKIKANKCWWAALDELRSEFDIEFLHLPRVTGPISTVVDDMSRKARQSLEAVLKNKPALPLECVFVQEQE